MIDGSKIHPKFGRVLIERKIQEKTAGGIINPYAKKHAALEGVIVALGETAGWTEVPETGYVQTLKIGDKVMFGRHAGTWLDETFSPAIHPEKKIGVLRSNDDGTLFMCQDSDILAVVDKEVSVLVKAA